MSNFRTWMPDEQKEKIKKLKEEGLSITEISKTLEMSRSTVQYHCSPEYREKALQRAKQRRQMPEGRKREKDYENKPEVIERKKQWRLNYFKNPEVRKRNVERIRKFYAKHIKPPNKEFEMVIDVFSSPDVKLSMKQVWEKIGGNYINVSRNIRKYYDEGHLIKETVGNNVVYSLNPESPCVYVADGVFKEKEKELDRLMRR